MGNPKNEGYTIGFTTDKGLMLDLDKTTWTEALEIAYKTTNKFDLKGFLIAKSSENNYHVVFDKFLSWETTLEILFKLVWSYHYHGHGCKPELTNWAMLQAIKHSITLRISQKIGYKKNKPRPKIMLIKGKKQQLIKEYLDVCIQFYPKSINVQTALKTVTKK